MLAREEDRLVVVLMALVWIISGLVFFLSPLLFQLILMTLGVLALYYVVPPVLMLYLTTNPYKGQ
jgi:hypothetical protein